MKLSEAITILEKSRKCAEVDCFYQCECCPYNFISEERDEAIDTVIQAYNSIFGTSRKDYDTFEN